MTAPAPPPFTHRSVDDIAEPCRGAKPSKAAGWDVDCVKKILCKKDKVLVEQLATTTVTKADEIYFDDPYFDGTKWTTRRFPAGGSASPQTREIMVAANTSCEDAAVTFHHEVWHQNQGKMGWPEPAEDDAYYNTELWTIERGLPTQSSGLRTKDPVTGKPVPDKKAIRELVQKEYPGPPPPVEGVAQPVPVAADRKNNRTKVRDPKTGRTKWRPSQEGDTFAGPEQRVNEQVVDAKKWKCP